MPIPTDKEPHEIADSLMIEIVTKIVDVEGPIHASEVVARIRDLWGLGRAGSRIQEKVTKSLAAAKRKGLLQVEDDFYSIAGKTVEIRDRSNVSSASLKKPDTLPPAEIKQAILAVVGANFGAGRDALPIEVARLFGFRSTSAQLKERIDDQIKKLLKQSLLSEVGASLTLATPMRQEGT